MATDVHYQPHFLAGLVAAVRMGVPVVAGAPSSPTDGDVWIDSTGPAISFRSGGATTTVTAGLTTEQIQDMLGTFFTDSSTVDAVYVDASNAMHFDVLDAPTVNGKTAAQIQSDTIAAIVAGASAAYDTLVEIQALLQADDTALSGLTTAVGLRARRYAADLTGGTATENVDHNLALANNGDFIAKVYVKATGVEEVYRVDGTTTNRVVVTDETGSNIPAGRRIFLVAL